MKNHTARVGAARLRVRDEFEPLFDRMYRPACVAGTDLVLFKSATGEEVDCMACVSAMSTR